jgi:hypothetical protein
VEDEDEAPGVCESTGILEGREARLSRLDRVTGEEGLVVVWMGEGGRESILEGEDCRVRVGGWVD